jgi:hypothetical protein
VRSSDAGARAIAHRMLKIDIHTHLLPPQQRVDWFALREGVYKTLTPDQAGVLRSEVFPGLWLQPTALWPGDLAAMLAILQQGLASPE